MLDVLSYPVSALMWLCHHLLGLALNPDSGITWSLSVVLLVITVRVVLFVPAVKQFRAMRRARELQPQMAELRRKYSGDIPELSRRVQRLRQEHGVSVLDGWLPTLVQLPLFLGLYHVLANFTRSGMTVEQSSRLSNGVFDAAEVGSFLHARLCGAPLSAYLAMPGDALHALGSTLGRADVAAVALPLVILAGVATVITGRHAIRQQGAVSGPAATLSRVFPWVFGLCPVLGGLFFPFPIAIALYWVTNNAWTLAQNYLLTRRFDTQDAARGAVGVYLAPRPGQKPKRARTRRRPCNTPTLHDD